MSTQLWFLIFLFIVPVSGPEAQINMQEADVLRTIVFVRTEGLGMTELFYAHTRNKKIRTLCQRMKSYYINTQPVIIEICRGKDLKLVEKDLELILDDLKKDFLGYKVEKENDYLLMCEEHVNKSIQLYTKLVQEQQWEDISYFSFEALPELFNLQQEIRKLRVR